MWSRTRHYIVACIIYLVTGGVMGANTTRDTQNAFLLGGSPSLEDIYNPKTGQALLIPGFPLSPPPPPADAVSIGIIDSGVIADHPQLKNLLVSMKSFADTDPADDIGHGTMVALQTLRPYASPEILKASGDNFNYPAIISAKVTDQYGIPSVEAVIKAIAWVVNQGAKIVNLSLGFKGDAEEYTHLCNAIIQHGDTMFFAAAGNFGPEVAIYPAACSAPNLLSVGEVRGGQVSSNSGQGDVYASTDKPFYQPWEYHLDLGNRASRASDFITARQEYALSLTQQKNIEALFQMALLDIHADDLEAAANNLKQALALGPEVAIVRSHLGAVRLMQERYNEAETLLIEALQQDPNDGRTAYNLGLTYLNLGRADQALSILKTLQQQNPDYPHLQSTISEAERRFEMVQE
jgi:hypothetical protein